MRKEEEGDAFSTITHSMGRIQQSVAAVAEEVAACASACQRVSEAFDRIRDVAQAFRRSPEELIVEARVLLERVNWHLRSAKLCKQVDGLHKPERFVEACQQVVSAHSRLHQVLEELQGYSPEITAQAVEIRVSVSKTDEHVRQILSDVPNLPVVRTVQDAKMSLP